MIRVHIAELLASRGFLHRGGAYDGKLNTNAAARALGMPQPQLWFILDHPDRIKLRTLDRLCTALGVLPEELLSYTPNTTSLEGGQYISEEW